MQDRNDIIIIEQLPVIIERFAQLSEEIDARVKEVTAMECTLDTVKAVKKVRAELNKDFEFYEGKRKEVKTAVMKPYNEFEDAYKRYVADKFKAADAHLKTQITEVEDGVKAQKRAELSAFYEEYRASLGLSFPAFPDWNPNITLTATVSALKQSAIEFLDKVKDDTAMIAEQEHAAEILVEYQRTLNAADAVMTVKRRTAAVEEQQKKQAEAEARRAAEAEAARKVREAIKQRAPAPVPVPVPAVIEDRVPGDDPMLTVAFTVTAPLSKLRELKRFLADGGYEYK